MGGLEALLPAGGVATVLAVIIGYLLNANRVDRQDYRAAVAAAEARRREEVAEAERRCDAEQAAHARTQEHLDLEREARRRAEDVAARATAAMERANDEIARLRREIQRLERDVQALTNADQGRSDGGGHLRDPAA